MDRSAIRETGSSDLSRPAPQGDFDGYTRRQAMKDLLAKHEEPSPAHSFWTAQARRDNERREAPWFLRILGLVAFAFAINIVWGTDAHACTITQKANEKPVVTDCAKKLTPAQAADIIRPNSYVAPPVCTDCDGPRIATAPYTGERWQQDFLRSAEFESRMKQLRNLGDYVPNGIPLVPYPYLIPAPPVRHRK